MLSDRYKFGLFVLRCLTPGDQGSTRTDPAAAAGVLDATGMGLLRDAIHGTAQTAAVHSGMVPST